MYLQVQPPVAAKQNQHAVLLHRPPYKFSIDNAQPGRCQMHVAPLNPIRNQTLEENDLIYSTAIISRPFHW